jgi:hypothetical protein
MPAGDKQQIASVLESDVDVVSNAELAELRTRSGCAGCRIPRPAARRTARSRADGAAQPS